MNFKKGDFVTIVPFDEANMQMGQYINGMNKKDWPHYGIVQLCNNSDTVIIEYNNDSWPVPTKFIKQKFSIGDKVNVIPWAEAAKTNLYNSVDNEVYDLSKKRWIKSGIIVGFFDIDVLVEKKRGGMLVLLL